MSSSDSSPTQPLPTPPSRKCGKCGADLEEGFVVDYILGGQRVTSWVSGAPEFGWGGGIHVKEQEQLYIQVFRCTNCGFLESYAPRIS